MSKLNDTQLVLLSKASQRDDRALEAAAPRQAKVTKAIEVLLKRGLIGEVTSERAMPVWRHGEESNEPRSLIVTDLGLVAIGLLADEGAEAPEVQPAEAVAPKPAAAPRKSSVSAPSGFNSKTAAVIKLLQRKEGASIAALIDATGWLPHSTRAALTGLRKKGYAIERGKAKDKTTTIYRVVKAPAAAEAA